MDSEAKKEEKAQVRISLHYTFDSAQNFAALFCSSALNINAEEKRRE